MTDIDVFNSINAVLAVKFATLPIYVTRVPKDFTRPSLLLEIGNAPAAASTHSTMRHTPSYTVTCFVQIDDHGNCDEMALLGMQDGVLHAFDAGHLIVGDRAPGITAVSGGSNPGEAYVDLSVQYDEARDIIQPTYEMMGDINIKTEV